MNMQTPPPRKLEFRLFDDIDITQRKIWLVEDFIGAGEHSCVFGPPGGSKSMIAVDMAAHIAAGVPWFGRRVQQGAVLFVAAERGGLVQRRLAAIKKVHGFSNIPLGVVSTNIDLCRNLLDADAIVRAMAELCAQTQQEPRLITIDTTSRAMAGGDENSPKDVGAFVAAVSRIQEATGAHLQVTHHVPHEQNRMRGHGALLAACDTTIAVERTGDLRTATVMKSNDGEEGGSVAFTIDGIELCVDSETGKATTAGIVVPSDATPITNKPAEPQLTANQRTMFGLLHEAGARGLSTDEWNAKTRELDIGTRRPATLHDIRMALKGKGLIQETANGWTVRH
jgi:hypothetical protein